MFEDSDGVEGIAFPPFKWRLLAWDQFRGTAEKTNSFEGMRYSLSKLTDAS